MRRQIFLLEGRGRQAGRTAVASVSERVLDTGGTEARGLTSMSDYGHSQALADIRRRGDRDEDGSLTETS